MKISLEDEIKVANTLGSLGLHNFKIYYYFNHIGVLMEDETPFVFTLYDTPISQKYIRGILMFPLEKNKLTEQVWFREYLENAARFKPTPVSLKFLMDEIMDRKIRIKYVG